LVEDHPDSAEALAHLLASLGHEVTVAGSVAEALAADWSAVDVLVSDIGLPDGSGYDLLVEARRRRPRPPLRAIALSGYGMESDRERSREAGFHVHLVKPTDLATLEGAIRQVLAQG
jgi:CheY-like chemotaxis protein